MTFSGAPCAATVPDLRFRMGQDRLPVLRRHLGRPRGRASAFPEFTNLQLLRPFPAGMNDRENQDHVFRDAIGDRVRQFGNHQFTGSVDSSRSPALRELFQLNGGIQNGCGNPRSRGGTVFGNVGMKRNKPANGPVGPPNRHCGGGSSFGVPQLRSQSTTLSCGTVSPASTSAKPARISSSFHSP